MPFLCREGDFQAAGYFSVQQVYKLFMRSTIEGFDEKDGRIDGLRCVFNYFILVSSIVSWIVSNIYAGCGSMCNFAFYPKTLLG